jgi:hypothetical protein
VALNYPYEGALEEPVRLHGAMLKDVFLLWHVHALSSGEEDAKLLGVCIE